MSLWNPERPVYLVLGLVLAYLAVWLGDELLTNLLAIMSGIAAIGCGVWYWLNQYDESSAPPMAAIVWVLAAAFFGWVAEPMTEFGYIPIYWRTPWLLVLVVGMIPAVLEVVELVHDIRIERKLNKAGKGT